MIFDEDGPLSNRERARSDLTEGGKACLEAFFEIKKDLEKDAQQERAQWITSLSIKPNYTFKTRWSPLTGLMSKDGRRAMADCAQTALLRAAEMGSADAAYAITRLPADAPGITPLTKEKRQALLEQAVDGDVADAYADLAELYGNRVVVYETFAPQNGQVLSAPSQETLCSGWKVIEQCLPRPILPLIDKGVERNSPAAQAMRGAGLVRPLNASADEVAQGWRLLQQAADTRDPRWLYVFAQAALSRPVPDDIRRAALDALDAADALNFPPAQYDLAKREMAREQNSAEQRRSLMRLYSAAQAGNREARLALIEAFEKGIGLGAPSPWLANIWKTGLLPQVIPPSQPE